MILKIVRSKWIHKGSKSVFLDFILENKSPWISLLTDACIAMDAKVIEGNSYLGRGAFGRVFRVTKGAEVFALKIVEKRSIGCLEQEVYALQSADHTGLTVRCVERVKNIPNGAAILLSPVGKPLALPLTEHDVSILFDLLWQLHLADLIHGDPRVPNVILVGETYIWIDLVEPQKADPFLRYFDVELLTRSILSTKNLDEELSKATEEYGDNSIRETLDKLVKIVCKYMKAKNNHKCINFDC